MLNTLCGLRTFPKLRAGFVVAIWLMLLSPAAWAEERAGLSDEAIADLAQRAMTAFDVPGIAIGIVQGDESVFAQGFGVRELGHPEPVDTATMFKIASTSKAFTTAALAILVDEGKIQWDGKLNTYIPEFKMYDPWVSEQFTVTDMLTHRSGLGKGAGDLMFWPEPNLYTQADIVHSLQFFKPESSFRTEYAYDNTMYVVAGEVVARMSGMSWNEFVQSRIMQPLGMQRCFADRIPADEMNNLAVPHGIVEGQLAVIERGRIPAQPPVSASAGGIICSLDSMLQWVKTQLNLGTSPDGLEIFSKEQSRQMWAPQTIRSVSENDYEVNKTHFKAYALGWRLEDMHGYKVVSHTGTLAGMLSYVVLIPELDLGVVVMINGSSSATRSAVMNTIVDSYLPVEPRDWIQTELDEIAEWTRTHPTEPESASHDGNTAVIKVLDDLSAYAGTYRDPWFGDVSIEVTDAGLYFRAAKSPKLNGPLTPSGNQQFIARWIDRSLDGDAHVQFVLDDVDQVQGMTMTRQYEWSDWSFNYQDLNFTRVE
jgi:CubicO group peptidase (beta-lactamase class C family)